ncbi:MAG: hypothetical protein M3440_01075 [Chloroflexota bacterium]|nr:hypothetical protein [Chloroflexota bacterium]
MNRLGLIAMILLFVSVTTTNSASRQTPKATAGAVEERSYENTCDGAQAYFDDWHEATDAYFERDRTWSETWEFSLAYYRASNPPPIVGEWTDANIAFWAALSDHFYLDPDPLSHGDAIHDAEEELEDVCEGVRIYQTVLGVSAQRADHAVPA